MKRLFTFFSLSLLFLYAISANVSAQPWYVASNGCDGGSGTDRSPFLTIEKAVSMVQAGISNHSPEKQQRQESRILVLTCLV